MKINELKKNHKEETFKGICWTLSMCIHIIFLLSAAFISERSAIISAKTKTEKNAEIITLNIELPQKFTEQQIVKSITKAVPRSVEPAQKKETLPLPNSDLNALVAKNMEENPYTKSPQRLNREKDIYFAQPSLSENSIITKAEENTFSAGVGSPLEHGSTGFNAKGIGSGKGARAATGYGLNGENIPDGMFSGKSFQNYFARCLQIIEQNKHYPEAALTRQIEGSVKVRLCLYENGNICDTTIIASSGWDILDREVIECIKRSSPFPIPPPSMLSEGKALFSLTIEFQLT